MAGLDGEGVRVVLAGTGSHATGSLLPDVRAVYATVQAVRSCLVEVCGVREQNLVDLVDPEGPEPLLDVIIGAARTASDVLLLYYVGHGVLDVAGQLHLATKATVDLAAKASFRRWPTARSSGATQLSGPAGIGDLGLLLLRPGQRAGSYGCPARLCGSRRASPGACR